MAKNNTNRRRERQRRRHHDREGRVYVPLPVRANALADLRAQAERLSQPLPDVAEMIFMMGLIQIRRRKSA